MYESISGQSGLQDMPAKPFEVTITAQVPDIYRDQANKLIEKLHTDLAYVAVLGTLDIQFGKGDNPPPEPAAPEPPEPPKPEMPNMFDHYALTPREADVAQLAAQGLTNMQIGLKLNIKASTVKCNIGRILRKTQAGNRAGIGYKLGLFDIDISEV